MSPIIGPLTCSNLAPAVTVTVTERPSDGELADWNRLVRQATGGDVAQLPQWARLRATVGFGVRYVLVYAGPEGELVGGAQVLERSVPVLGRVGYIPNGPVVADAYSDQPAVRTALCSALAGLGRSRLRMLFVQPPPGAEAISAELLERGFRSSDANIAPGQTLRLDLSREVTALRGGLSKTLRTWTNRWDAHGVTVRLGTRHDVPVLAELVARSGQHQGFAAVTGDYLAELVAELSGEPGREDGHAELFIGELHGRPVAAALYSRCGDTLKLRFAGMDRGEAASRGNVPAAVQWQAILWAKRAGLRWFDFGGISPEAAAALAAGRSRGTVRGVDRFKASFGGEPLCSAPAVELIPNPVVRAGYDLSRRSTMGRRLIELAKAVLRTGRLR